MRILVVAPGPSFSVADVQHGWEKALRALGHEVRTYNLDDRLAFFGAAQWHKDDGSVTTLEADEAVRLAVEPLGNACYRFWPDIIFVVSGFFIPDDLWNTWKHRPHKTVLLCTESPYEDTRQFEQMMTGEPYAVLLNDPTNAHVFAKHHPRVTYVPHAYDPEVHHPLRGEFPVDLYDFGFVGTGYPSRADFFARVDWSGLRVGFGGNWKPTAAGTVLERFVFHNIEECLDNEDTADVYRSSLVSANLYRARDGKTEANDPRLTEGWAVGPREIELAATETFFLREPRPEGDELFPMLPTFTEPGEFEDQLRYYVKHDNERQNAARRAREAILDRTFDAHARQLMQLLDV